MTPFPVQGVGAVEATWRSMSLEAEDPLQVDGFGHHDSNQDAKISCSNAIPYWRSALLLALIRDATESPRRQVTGLSSSRLASRLSIDPVSSNWLQSHRVGSLFANYSVL